MHRHFSVLSVANFAGLVYGSIGNYRNQERKVNTHTPTNILIANQVQSISRPLAAYQAALAWEDCAELAKNIKGDKHQDYKRNVLRSQVFFVRGEELEARDKEIDLEFEEQ